MRWIVAVAAHGLVVLAASLVLSVPASAQELPTAPSTSRTPEELPAADALLWPATSPEAAVHRPRIERGHDEGWIIVGAILLGGGYIAGIVLGVADQLGNMCRAPAGGTGPCNTWPFALVPIAGGLISNLLPLDGSRFGTSMMPGVPYTMVAQAVGVTFLVFALAGYTERVVPAAEIAGVELRFAPLVSATDGGLAMGIEF